MGEVYLRPFAAFFGLFFGSIYDQYIIMILLTEVILF